MVAHFNTGARPDFAILGEGGGGGARSWAYSPYPGDLANPKMPNGRL